MALSALVFATACPPKVHQSPTVAPEPSPNCAIWTCDGSDCWCDQQIENKGEE